MIDIRTRPVTERIPSVAQIDRARTPLKQAAEIAIMIDAMDSWAPDATIERHCQQFQFQMEQVAMRLGFELVPMRPVLAIDNSNMREVK